MGETAAGQVAKACSQMVMEAAIAVCVEARRHHKDFALLMNEAHRLGRPLPAAGKVGQQLNALMGKSLARPDTTVLLSVTELAGRQR